jgi:deoxyribodipyrimidine photolyase
MTPNDDEFASIEFCNAAESDMVKSGHIACGSCRESVEYLIKSVRGLRAALATNDAALATAVRGEREACAKVADKYAAAAVRYAFKVSKRKNSECIANAIRQRGVVTK